jgi:iron(III) transport system permease protein
MGGHLNAAVKRLEEPVLLAATGVVVVSAVLLPVAVLGGGLISPGGIGRAIGLLAGAGLSGRFARSVLLSASVTGLAVLIGVPLGLLSARAQLPGRRAALAFHTFPMFLPPFLLALGWFNLFGRGGLLGSETTSRLLFSALGVILVETLAFTPVVTLLTALAVAGVDPSLEEAGRVVAPPWRVAARILLPAAWPATALGALIVFALSLSELGVPMFLGVRGYSEAVFSRLGGVAYAPGEAFTLALPLLGVGLLLLALERRLARRYSHAVLGLRIQERAGLPLGRAGLACGAGLWAVAVVGLLPIASLALRAARGGGFASLRDWIGSSPLNGLLAGAVSATLAVLVALVLGRALARERPGAKSLDAVSVLGFITPATVLGVGLIALWNRPATHALYGSMGIIVIGFLARYGVIATRTVAAGIAQTPAHLEEAAAAFGASFLRRLLRIVIPVSARSILGAWLLTLVFCLRDLETVILFYPPGRETLPVRIFTLEANGPAPVVAGLACVHVLITAGALVPAAILIAGRRRGT